MSSDESSNAPSERRDAVREKAQQVQARQARTRRLRALSVVASVVAIVAIAAVVVAWAVGSAASKPQLSPANVADDGFFVTSATGLADTGGPTSGTPTPTPAADEGAEPEETAAETATPEPTEQSVVDIRVYVDYLSAGSREFQLANAPQLSKWVGEGAADLTYYPVAMLTAKSNGTKYSLRAASAAACVATHSRDTFFAYNHALLSQQPELDSDGFTDVVLADIAQASGVDSPKVVRACIQDQSFAAWAKAATERALSGLPDTDGVALTGTPMVLVNGAPYVGALDDPKEFAQFVLTMASDAYYKATPTPTPTATPAE
ncbi:DsbA family protein [Microbacterium sp. NPDC055910]|uniref:DsbA family protein n=1 Tax=Microbacterium sp. NPDC055910 TaxID=3345659 RepID=UPI0035E27922